MIKKVEPYSYLAGKVLYIKRGQYVQKKGTQYILRLLVEGKRKKLNSIIPVIVYQKQIDRYDIKTGDYLSILGDLVITDNKSEFVLSVSAKKIIKLEEEEYREIISSKEDNNKTVLIGYITKFPVIAKTANGKGSYIKASLAIEKKNQKFEYVPCLCTFTKQNSSTIIVGNKVCVVGRLESRNKTKEKNGVVKTSYELFVTYSVRYKYE